MSLADGIRLAVLKRLLLSAVQWLAKQFGWRAPPDIEPIEHAPVDRSPDFTRDIPDAPKPPRPRRTAKRAPKPPESLSGGQ